MVWVQEVWIYKSEFAMQIAGKNFTKDELTENDGTGIVALECLNFDRYLL